MDKTTCQICEREIKANTGVIAHHGYRRPDRGSGWQTDSCWGARHLPYEKSCDQIQPCIDHIDYYVENQEKRLKEMLKNPPLTLTRVSMMWTREPKVYGKPEGFDPKSCMERGSFSGGMAYEYEFYTMYKDIERSVKEGKRDIKRLKARLAAWVAPK